MPPDLSRLLPSEEVAAHPVVAAVRDLAGTLLRPAAERVDVAGLPSSHLAALARTGLFGLSGPAGYGGTPAPAAVTREVTELLSGSCGTTWFVAAQHTTPVTVLAGSDNGELRDRWLAALCRGEAVGGIALAHVRRPGPPAVRATPAGAGWRLSGAANWYTGWGLNDVALVAACTDDDRIVFALVPAVPRDRLAASADLPLAAMQGTHTVALTFTGLRVAAHDVADVVPRSRWLAADRAKTANVTPAVLGLLRALLTAVARHGEERELPEAVGFAGRAGARAAALRAAAYRLVDDVPAGERLDQRLTLRTQALELLGRAAQAYVVCCGGRGMSRTHPAQRWAREAMFHQVQAQTGAVRAGTLAALTGAV